MSALFKSIAAFLGSSIGKKILVALTGAVLVVFVLGHMIGNLLIYAGPAAINEYGHFLRTMVHGAGLWIARAALLACAVVHVLLTILLTRENRSARGSRYGHPATIQAGRSSLIMIWSGLTLLAFVIYHILHFTVHAFNDFGGARYKTTLHGETVHNVYRMVVDGFSWLPASAFYIVAMGLLCSHLGHGTSSLFQTLGLSNERLRPLLAKIGWCLATVVFLGNISIPVSVLLGVVK